MVPLPTGEVRKMTEVEHFLSIHNRLGEGPLWHPDEGALYWVDIDAGCYYCMDPDDDSPRRFDVGLPVGCLAFRQKGGLVAGTQKGLAFFDPEKETLTPIVDPEAHMPETRFNDGAVDRQGRFWAGTLGRSGGCGLYRLDPDLSLHTMETGISVSNGTGWSPDNRTMYYTDSGPRVIYAYDFDPATGAIANRRPFVDDQDEPGVPDGLTVDSDGFVWSARWDGWKIVRYDPRGKVEREIPMPVQRPTACIFGGPDLDELYITSASVGLDAAAKQQQPLAGDLFRLKTEVKGMPVSKFAG
jgi:L-arabinonolactonase